ncbi:hypothetical protein BLA60_39550 [Actinophytocola xinjiangensis]|uniref:Uncharacterized protein n=1 Tax=Actinophytocola xinjiangensis TaxID=485602 RepID=A0A7Z0WDZ1_9PSEU|nr:hypothetical protein BLA60_39550 [Actinophytocola xinjiangensis]
MQTARPALLPLIPVDQRQYLPFDEFTQKAQMVVRRRHGRTAWTVAALVSGCEDRSDQVLGPRPSVQVRSTHRRLA